MCSRDAKSTDNTLMSIEFIERVIDEALEFTRLQTINLTGGEAFLYPDLEKLIATITRRNIDIRINTNGLFFTDSNIEMLNRYQVKLFTIIQRDYGAR